MAKKVESNQPLKVQVAELLAAVEAGNPPEVESIWPLAWKCLGTDFTVRMRRPAELNEDQRSMVRVIMKLDAVEPWMSLIGLPSERWLPRFLGDAPAGPVDRVVGVDRNAQPVWCLMSDAVHEVLPISAVAKRLASGASTKELVLACEEALTEPYDLFDRRPRTKGEDVPHRIPKKEWPLARAHFARVAALFHALFSELGDAGERLATKLASPSDPPNAFAALIGCSYLARRARATGSVLDPRFDAAIATALTSIKDDDDPWRDVTFALLDQVPAERAAMLGKVMTLDVGRMSTFWWTPTAYLERYPPPDAIEHVLRFVEAFDPKKCNRFPGDELTQYFLEHHRERAAVPIQGSIAKKHPQREFLVKTLALLAPKAPKKKKPKPKAPAKRR